MELQFTIETGVGLVSPAAPFRPFQVALELPPGAACLDGTLAEALADKVSLTVDGYGRDLGAAYPCRLEGQMNGLPVSAAYSVRDIQFFLTPDKLFPLTPYVNLKLAFSSSADSGGEWMVRGGVYLFGGTVTPLVAMATIDGVFRGDGGWLDASPAYPFSTSLSHIFPPLSVFAEPPDEVPLLVPTDGRPGRSVSLVRREPVPFMALFLNPEIGYQRRVHTWGEGASEGTYVPAYSLSAAELEDYHVLVNPSYRTQVLSLLLINGAEPLQDAFGLQKRQLAKIDRRIREQLDLPTVKDAQLHSRILALNGLADLSEEDVRTKLSTSQMATFIRRTREVEARPWLGVLALAALEGLEEADLAQLSTAERKALERALKPVQLQLVQVDNKKPENCGIPPEVAKYALARAVGTRPRAWQWHADDEPRLSVSTVPTWHPPVSNRNWDIWVGASIGFGVPIFSGVTVAATGTPGIAMPASFLPYWSPETDELPLLLVPIVGHPLVTGGLTVSIRPGDQSPGVSTPTRAFFARQGNTAGAGEMSLDLKCMVDPARLGEVPPAAMLTWSKLF